MGIVTTRHQEKGLACRFCSSEKVPGEAAIDRRVSAPEIFIALSLPRLCCGPPEKLLLIQGFSNSATEESGSVQERGEGWSSGADTLESFGAIILRIKSGQHHAAGGSADGNIGIAMPELYAFLGESVYVGRDALGDTSEATGGVPVHVISDQPEDIRANGGLAKLLRAEIGHK